jgi:glycosyltransferase involved in cell wall biosynthesis
MLVTPQDSDSLHEGLAKLLSNSDLRATMGSAARQRAIDLFAAERVTTGLIKEYLRLLQERGSK